MPIDRRLDLDDEFDDRDPPTRKRSRDEYDDRDEFDLPHSRPVRKGVNICGVIALVVAILGLLLSAFPCTSIIGVPAAGVALIVGIVGLLTSGRTSGRGMPIAATCVAAAGLIIGGIWLALGYAFFKKADERVEAKRVEMEKEVEIAREKRQQAEDRQFRDGKGITLTADELYDAFDNNPRDADTNYRNKVMEVSGTIRRVARDPFGRMSVEFAAANIVGGVVKCEFPRDAQGPLDKLKPNQKVTIRGRCVGKNKRDEVRLENCSVVSK